MVSPALPILSTFYWCRRRRYALFYVSLRTTLSLLPSLLRIMDISRLLKYKICLLVNQLLHTDITHHVSFSCYQASLHFLRRDDCTLRVSQPRTNYGIYFFNFTGPNIGTRCFCVYVASTISLNAC